MNIERIELQTGVALELLAAFYGRLGFASTAPDGETLCVRAGASELIFRFVPGATGAYHFAFNVPENRIEAAREFLIARHVPFLAGADGETVFDFDFWNAHTLYFRDPAGNIAEFIARHELPASGTTNAPFAPGEVEGISEIALPTPDVATLTANLCDALNASTYRGTSETFAPVGDAHGMLIVVREGREWFPQTGIAAEALPVVAAVTTTNGARFVVQSDPYRVTQG